MSITIPYIDFDNFNINKLEFNKIEQKFYYNYINKGKSSFNILIKNIEHYYFYNIEDKNKSILYFNLSDDNIDKINKLIKQIEDKFTNNNDESMKLKNLRTYNIINLYNYYYYNKTNTYDKLNIFKSKHINIDLNKNKFQILNNLNNNDYTINIIISFDNIQYYDSYDNNNDKIYLSSLYRPTSYITYIKINKFNEKKYIIKEKFKYEKKDLLTFEDKYKYYKETGIDKYNIMKNNIL